MSEKRCLMRVFGQYGSAFRRVLKRNCRPWWSLHGKRFVCWDVSWMLVSMECVKYTKRDGPSWVVPCRRWKHYNHKGAVYEIINHKIFYFSLAETACLEFSWNILSRNQGVNTSIKSMLKVVTDQLLCDACMSCERILCTLIVKWLQRAACVTLCDR